MASHATPIAKEVLSAKGTITEELLANGDLTELDGGRFASWSDYDAGYALDRAEKRSGRASALCANPDGALRLGAVQSLELNRTDIRPLLASGWSKCQDVAGTPSSNYSIYVDLIYQDGTPLWGRTANFSCGSHDWEYREVKIVPEKPVKRVTVYALFRGIKGKAWFDDISLKEGRPAPGVVLFDGAATRPAPTLERPSVLVRDVAADSHFYMVGAPAATESRQAIPEIELAVTTKRAGGPAGTQRIDILVEDLARRDRAITVYYVVPEDLVGGKWHDNVRQYRTIGGDQAYSNTVGNPVGAIGQTSRYPFACVSNDRRGQSLLVPSPCVNRFAYDGRSKEFYAAFDLGLAQDTRTPGRAAVSLYHADMQFPWGMRHTAQLFYDLLPQYFDQSRVPDRQGNWMPFLKISSVQQPEDFHFAVHEGNNDVQWDNDHGVQPFVYVEPMTWWMRMPPEVARTHQAALDYMRSFLGQPDSPSYDRAWAVEQSCLFDEHGRHHLEIRNAPWCDGAVFANSADPDVPEREGHLNLAHYNLRNLERALQRAEAEGGLAGVYLDSIEGWGTLRNCRREHFAAADLPLTFDARTGRVAILNYMSTMEFTLHMCDWMRQQGKLLMANYTPHRWPYLCLPLDVMGTETNWQRDGRLVEPDPSFMYLKRTLAWHKPYMFLMNTHFESWTAEMTERYMQICLFYGMFPGFFSENASSNHYFANPEWYNRDRPLYKRYLPVIKTIAQAGWEPVTYATSSNESVWVERWGTSPTEGLYFTVMNTADQAREARLELELEGTKGRAIRSLLTGEELGAAPEITLSLEAGEVLALAVR
ncbi:MAG: hypothetical protein ACE5R4_03290 [Armatimonadota bacterium]